MDFLAYVYKLVFKEFLYILSENGLSIFNRLYDMIVNVIHARLSMHIVYNNCYVKTSTMFSTAGAQCRWCGTLRDLGLRCSHSAGVQGYITTHSGKPVSAEYIGSTLSDRGIKIDK